MDAYPPALLAGLYASGGSSSALLAKQQVKAALNKYGLCGKKDLVCQEEDDQLFDQKEGEVRVLQDVGAS